MRYLFAVSCLCVSMAGQAAEKLLNEKQLNTAVQLRENALQGNESYALLESLTTEIGPRLAGSENYQRATLWAQEKFNALGFDKVWLQPVQFPQWQRNAESAVIISPFPQKLAITALGGSVGTQGVIRAEVVEFKTLQALKDAPENSLRGKIAFVNQVMERAQDGHGYGPVSTIRRSSASEAAKKGALASIIRSAGTDNNRLPHTGMMRYEEGVSKIPTAALSTVDAELLSHMLKRDKPVVIEMNLQVGFTGKIVTQYNIIAEITGRKLPNEYVVIGGHLDSWDLGTGAVDDGSGVTITMAAGALIAGLPKAPKRSIRVIAFANEEQGIYGGKAYAEFAKAQLAQHQLGVESDFGAERIYALQARVSEEAKPVIAQIAEILKPLDIQLDWQNGGPGADVSDLATLGMPWAELAQDGTKYFDLHHTANDTLDKVDPKALDQQVAAYAVLAYLAADAEQDFGSSLTKQQP